MPTPAGHVRPGPRLVTPTTRGPRSRSPEWSFSYVPPPRSVSCPNKLPARVVLASRGMLRQRGVRLALIATAAGAYSALFGVGGGTVIVPLLIVWFGYTPHEATGTSLAAIAVIAAFAAAAQGTYGNVDVVDGL